MQKIVISPESGRVLFWGAVVALISIVGGLVVWYLFINAQKRQVDEISAARGFNSEIPTFAGVGSSMRENAVNFFRSAFDATTSEATTTAVTEVPKHAPRLWRVNSIPSLGVAVFGNDTASSLGSVKFVERTSGNIFYKPVASGATPIRITNTLIPFVYDVRWIDDNSLIIRHSNDGGVTLRTFLGNIVQSTTTGGFATLAGGYLDGGTTVIAINPSHKEPALFYLVKTDTGVVGITAQSNGKNPKRIWSSPISGWNVSWVAPDSIILAQKAAAGIPGSVYRLSPSTKEVVLVLGNLNGLVAVPHPTEDAVIYSTSGGGIVRLFARVFGVVRELPVSTIAEKCLWGIKKQLIAYCAVPSSLPEETLLPDAWYRGETHFTDRWYTVDPIQGTAAVLLDSSGVSDAALDVVAPELTPAGDTILFTDAKSGTPWMLRVAL